MSAPATVVAADIAAAIGEEHEAAQAAARNAVAHAIHCGELLLEAKASLPHGVFGTWLARNVAFSDRTARGYMRLAGLDDAKRQRVANFSLRAALQSLATPSEPTSPATLEVRTFSRDELMAMPIEELDKHRLDCLKVATRAFSQILEERDIPPVTEIPRVRDMLKHCTERLIGIGAASPSGQQHGLVMMAFSQIRDIERMLDGARARIGEART